MPPAFRLCPTDGFAATRRRGALRRHTASFQNPAGRFRPDGMNLQIAFVVPGDVQYTIALSDDDLLE
jgi:hypothetical protein